MKGLIVASMCQLKDDFLLFICLYQSKERGHEPMEYHSIGEKLTAALKGFICYCRYRMPAKIIEETGTLTLL